jgi:hypothetical protein
MTTQLQENITYLQKNQPATYEMVKKTVHSRENSSQKLVMNNNQTFNIQSHELEGALLYSKYDPVHECNRWCESLQLNADIDKDIILFGLGLTYHLSALMERYPNRRFFIYEPEVELFVEMLNIVDVSMLYDHGNIKYIGVGKNEVSMQKCLEAINKYCSLQYDFVYIPFYEKLSLDTEKQFLIALRQIDLRRKAIVGFHQTFGKMMYRNTLRNIPTMLKTPTLQTFENLYEGSTAIVIGGGPSLQYDIENIKKIQDKWLIIAAGSSVQSLTHYGITPHLIVSMDAGVYNAKIFRANNFIDIPLLMMPQIHHEIVTLHNDNNMYAYYDNDVIVNFLIPYQDQNYIMRPTYSVTGTAIQAAIYMGAEKVVLAGQDLSYPGREKYAPGAAHLGNNELGHIDKELLYEVQNVKGTTNPTTFSMLQTLKDIEQLIVMMSEKSFINTSKEGAAINGSMYRDMETLIDEPTLRRYPFHKLKSILHENPVYHSVDILVPINRLQTAIQYVTNLMEKIKWIEEELNKLNRLSRTSPNKGVALLKAIEQQLNQLFAEDIFVRLIKEWFIVEYHTFERQLLDVSKEPRIIKKTTLLIQILSPFLNKMIIELPGIKNELTIAVNNLIKER